MSCLMTKQTKWPLPQAKTLISLGICPVWSESSLSSWRNLGSLATHWAPSEDSNQTGQMPRLIWVFAGCTVILLVLSWGGSNDFNWIECLLNVHMNFKIFKKIITERNLSPFRNHVFRIICGKMSSWCWNVACDMWQSLICTSMI